MQVPAGFGLGWMGGVFVLLFSSQSLNISSNTATAFCVSIYLRCCTLSLLPTRCHSLLQLHPSQPLLRNPQSITALHANPHSRQNLDTSHHYFVDPPPILYAT